MNVKLMKYCNQNDLSFFSFSRYVSFSPRIFLRLIQQACLFSLAYHGSSAFSSTCAQLQLKNERNTVGQSYTQYP